MTVPYTFSGQWVAQPAKPTGTHGSVNIGEVLTELHREFHKRREHIFDALRTYATFCGISVGWVVTAKTLDWPPRLFLIFLLLFFAGAGVLKGLGVSKSQSNTAKTIVRINRDLGLFRDYFPPEWEKWGDKRDYWYVFGFAGVGLAAALVVAFYRPEVNASGYSRGDKPDIMIQVRKDAVGSTACCANGKNPCKGTGAP